MKANKPANFPCLRCRMGEWWYYTTSMTFREIAQWIQPVNEVHLRADLSTWIQRELAPDRLEKIANYLVSQREHFFNAIVAGVYEGEPDWFPIDVHKNSAMPGLDPKESAQDVFGFLHLNGDEKIFAIDGQHRVEGIRAAIKRKKSLEDDQQCIIFVGHAETDKGRERTRRLFSTLNKYAKPVSKGEQIALSEDDTFALVTRRLIHDYPYLNIDFAPLTTGANIPPTDKKSITTIFGLYNLIKAITPLKGRGEKRSLEDGPPSKERVQEVFDGAVQFWDLLRQHVPEIKKVTDSKPEKELAGKYRNKEGGHVLFRPAGLLPFAKAVRVMLDRGVDMPDAVGRLSRTTLDLNRAPWPGVLWNQVGQKMIQTNAQLAVNMLLHMARMKLQPDHFPLLQRYRKALDDQKATLDGIKRI